MSQLGEVKKAFEIGYKGRLHYVWSACVLCRQERWVILHRGEARNPTCRSCRDKALRRSCGSSNRYWKGGVRIHPMGYILVRIPNHPNAYANGYVSRARLVLEKTLGRLLVEGAIPHHRGTRYPIGSIENKQDDRPDNLEELLMATHYKFHSNGRARDARGRFTAMHC